MIVVVDVVVDVVVLVVVVGVVVVLVVVVVDGGCESPQPPHSMFTESIAMSDLYPEPIIPSNTTYNN